MHVAESAKGIGGLFVELGNQRAGLGHLAIRAVAREHGIELREQRARRFVVGIVEVAGLARIAVEVIELVVARRRPDELLAVPLDGAQAPAVGLERGPVHDLLHRPALAQ